MRTGMVVLAALALLLGACSDDAEQQPATTETASPTTTQISRPDVELLVDRLVIVDNAGGVATMDRSGGDVIQLAPETEVAFQPIWSPDSSAIAYATRTTEPSFVIADPGGGDALRLATPTSIFYAFWSPDGSRLGTLRNGSDGIEFEFVSAGDGDISIEPVVKGQPFYFAWEPSGAELVAHVGLDRIFTVDLAGDSTPIDQTPAPYRAPAWTQDGVISAAIVGDRQEIVRLDAAGNEEAIAEIGGGPVFGANGDGTLLAVQSVLSEDDGNATEVILVEEPLAPNRLHVIDLASGEVKTVTRRPVLAFFWSPVGDDLLVLELQADGATMQWSVWDGAMLEPGPEFLPTATFVTDFLPFFDQYAHSMRLWAPDGGAYAFAGDVGGDRGIWVVDVDTGDAALVSDGVWVSWSPT